MAVTPHIVMTPYEGYYIWLFVLLYMFASYSLDPSAEMASSEQAITNARTPSKMKDER